MVDSVIEDIAFSQHLVILHQSIYAAVEVALFYDIYG